MVFTQVFTPGSMCQDPTAICVPVRVFFTTLSLGRNQRGVVTYHSCSLLDICLCIGSCPHQVSTGKLSLLAGSSSVTALLTQPVSFMVPKTQAVTLMRLLYLFCSSEFFFHVEHHESTVSALEPCPRLPALHTNYSFLCHDFILLSVCDVGCKQYNNYFFMYSPK